MVQSHVLRRPQPPAAPDVVAADDAIRSRSLHVIAGAGAGLVLYLAVGQLLGLDVAVGPDRFAFWLGLVATPAVAPAGWWVAALPWRRGNSGASVSVSTPEAGVR